MTTPAMPLVFKVATDDWEFEQIHQLNYRTFVEEIPQHARNPEGRLVDRFHEENTYLICLHDQQLVGMMAMRGKRPFSLDSKLPSLDQHLPAGRVPIEVRLLAVLPEFRKTAVFTSLFEHAVKYCLAHGFDIAVISGTTRQARLYQHLGFVPFGPLVGTESAPYQPMYLTLEAFGGTLERSAVLRKAFPGDASEARMLNFLPGPVTPHPSVQTAFSTVPVSHRATAFLTRMATLRESLCRLTGAPDVQVLVGSGTLANDVVAAQLSLHETTGLVVSNGEFGERLAAIARRARLRFDWLRLPWGESFDLAQANQIARRLPRGGWLWCVHHETSTGVVNPLEDLKSLCALLGLHLCADCISSVGALPLDLRGVHLATATSSKGLAGYPGLSMVFHDYLPRSEPDRLPSYLDLGHWAAQHSVPHTHSSNLINALAEAVRRVTPERMERWSQNAAWLRRELHASGFTLVAPESVASPALVTVNLGDRISAAELGEELETRGIWLSYRSQYLQERNWIQAALFSDPSQDDLDKLMAALRAVCGRSSARRNQEPAALKSSQRKAG